MGISSTKLAVVLILSLFLIGGFYAEAAGRINGIEGKCETEHNCSSDDECNSRCTPLGYPRGICVKPIGSFCCCIKNTA
ncbi:hypothetical protein C5167_004515 [Papaver somniferum]|uniref:Knottin scorpion toxin-like domain-containing protein n=1 Tax=Papaver somniferum TaxID=3469 RepID=A0A4Y7JBT6_PAPSO|nr:hypothetical protein C5167_004515 [Papaver somniferum]